MASRISHRQRKGASRRFPVRAETREDQAIDLLESLMLAHGPCAAPEPVHRFTPGLYARELTMPAGTLCTSRVHKVEHQYIVTKGRARVYVPGVGWEEIVAPYHGITKAGTRRVLQILEDMTWTTFHPTDETDPAKLDELLWDIRPVRELGEAERHAVLEWAAGASRATVGRSDGRTVGQRTEAKQ